MRAQAQKVVTSELALRRTFVAVRLPAKRETTANRVCCSVCAIVRSRRQTLAISLGFLTWNQLEIIHNLQLYEASLKANLACRLFRNVVITPHEP